MKNNNLLFKLDMNEKLTAKVNNVIIREDVVD